jgi:hypothetical protein
MPQQGHRVFATMTVRLSKTVNAPLRYVYDWCTDYRSDDWRLGRKGSNRPKIRVLRVSPHQVIRIRVRRKRSDDSEVTIDLVQLSPPSGWHTDQIDVTDRMAMDYHLVKLGPKRSRLDLLCTERYVTPDFPTPGELRQQVSATWDRLVAAVEERYRSGAPARG